MKEVIMQVPSFSADYPKAPICVAELVRCGECIYWKNSLCQAWHRVIPKDGYCSIGERDRSTQTETQNSNLTFEKVMEEIQTQVIEFPDTHQKFVFARKIEMDGDSIKIGGWEYKGVKDGEREGE